MLIVGKCSIYNSNQATSSIGYPIPCSARSIRHAFVIEYAIEWIVKQVLNKHSSSAEVWVAWANIDGISEDKQFNYSQSFVLDYIVNSASNRECLYIFCSKVRMLCAQNNAALLQQMHNADRFRCNIWCGFSISIINKLCFRNGYILSDFGLNYAMSHRFNTPSVGQKNILYIFVRLEWFVQKSTLHSNSNTFHILRSFFLWILNECISFNLNPLSFR